MDLAPSEQNPPAVVAHRTPVLGAQIHRPEDLAAGDVPQIALCVLRSAEHARACRLIGHG